MLWCLGCWMPGRSGQNRLLRNAHPTNLPDVKQIPVILNDPGTKKMFIEVASDKRNYAKVPQGGEVEVGLLEEAPLLNQ